MLMFIAQQLNLNIDLGQVLISVLVGVIGYFLKRSYEKLEERMDEQDGILNQLRVHVAELRAMMNRRAN